MNKDRVKGTIDEVVGAVKRTAGKWAGDTPLQIKGMAQQVKGKLENTIGKAKDTIHESSTNIDLHREAGTEYPATDAKHPRSD